MLFTPLFRIEALAIAMCVVMGFYWIRLTEYQADNHASCSCIGDPSHIPHCAPKDGNTDEWKRHPVVGYSKTKIAKQFGTPDGVWEQPYWLIPGSDETWVYHGEGVGWNRSGQHIFVFSNGKCVAASDTFVYNQL